MEVIDLDALLSGNAQKQKDESDRSRKTKRKPDKNTGKKSSIVAEIVHFLLVLVFVFVGAVFIVTYIGQRTRVNGSSMETTMSDGDNLVVDKISYRLTSPKRFDIVVFPYHSSEKEVFYIKRIIGLPGEKVQISDGVIYINDKPLDENYGYEKMLDARLAASPITLGDDEYFVLGDNRNHSSDSREIGAVKRENIVGRAVFRIWPLRKFGVLK